mgnify:CR=1 FL=1
MIAVIFEVVPAPGRMDLYLDTARDLRPLLDGIELGPQGLHAYFVHSYALNAERAEDVLALTDYGGPVTAMVAGSFAVTTMLTKNAFLEEIRKQYVLTARAKGLSDRQVLWKHVLRNALIPIITGFPAAFIGAFFTGSLLIETLYSLDGLGLLSYESVIRRDYPVVLGTLYLFTLIGLVTKLVSDLCYVWVDPRVKFD